MKSLYISFNVQMFEIYEQFFYESQHYKKNDILLE